MEPEYSSPDGEQRPAYPAMEKNIKKAGQNLKERNASKRRYLSKFAVEYGPEIVLTAFTTALVCSSLYFMENPDDFQAIQNFLSGLS